MSESDSESVRLLNVELASQLKIPGLIVAQHFKGVHFKHASFSSPFYWISEIIEEIQFYLPGGNINLKI